MAVGGGVSWHSFQVEEMSGDWIRVTCVGSNSLDRVVSLEGEEK